MSRRPTPITLRAVQLLREGPVPREILVCELWPLVDPGIAYRIRQADRDRQLAKLRASGKREISRRELTATEAVEIGARRKIAQMLKTWQARGIVDRVMIDDRIHVRLLREPTNGRKTT